MQALLLSEQDVGKTKQIQKFCLTIPFNIVLHIWKYYEGIKTFKKQWGFFCVCLAGTGDICEHGTYFLASVFPNFTSLSAVVYLLCVLLSLSLGWQGVPWTAQQGHLPPTAICAQVFLIPSLCQPIFSRRFSDVALELVCLFQTEWICLHATAVACKS